MGDLPGLTGRPGNGTVHACWRHSLATALTCKRWAGPMGLEEERCYTAGLVHDIGQLALLHLFRGYEGAMAAALERGEPLPEAERRAFGVNHGEAGKWLLARWDARSNCRMSRRCTRIRRPLRVMMEP